MDTKRARGGLAGTLETACDHPTLVLIRHSDNAVRPHPLRSPGVTAFGKASANLKAKAKIPAFGPLPVVSVGS